MSTNAPQGGRASRSRFGFRGTVQKLHATTMPQVPASDRTVVVRVDEVLHAPETLGDWTGKNITVYLAEGEQVEEGQQAIFDTTGWLYGDSIAVRSLGHREVETGHPAEVLASRDLQAHVADADLVVAGRVTAVRLPAAPAGREAAAAGPVGRLSEHDPDWHEAVVHVDHVVKGSHADPDVVVRFPNSTDVAWYRVPKLRPGDDGVFMLHGGPAPGERLAAAAAPPTYTMLHPLDFQPREKLEQMRSFAAGAPG